METIPIYVIAMIVAIANMTTDIYDVHAWNLGTVKAEPWRTKISTGALRAVSAIRELWQTAWCYRRGLATAGLLALIVFAPSVVFGHDGAGGVSFGIAIAQLETDLRAKQAQATAMLNRIQAQAAAEGRTMTATEKAGVQELLDEGKSLKGRIDRAHGDVSMTAAIDQLTAGMTGAKPSRRGNGPSIGQQIIDSETGRYLLMMKQKGGFPTGAWVSPASELMAATLTEDSASGGDVVIADTRPGILPLPTRPLVVADLIAPGTTESNLVTYMKETTFTNAADTVAEAGPKPESTLIFDAVSDPVRKIATWLPVTDEMLEDVPTLRSYLDARLSLAVQLAEDDQLLNGSVVAPDIIGFLARTGLAASIARVAESNADVILAQIAAIETATGLAVDGIVMNPTQWKTILLLKDSTGNYLVGGGPLAPPARPVLWGRPVALTSAIVAGTALVGAFRTASQVFRKGGLRVEASNSHASFFTSNLTAIRAEERLALAVYRPSAFGTCTNLN